MNNSAKQYVFQNVDIVLVLCFGPFHSIDSLSHLFKGLFVLVLFYQRKDRFIYNYGLLLQLLSLRNFLTQWCQQTLHPSPLSPFLILTSLCPQRHLKKLRRQTNPLTKRWWAREQENSDCGIKCESRPSNPLRMPLKSLLYVYLYVMLLQ